MKIWSKFYISTISYIINFVSKRLCNFYDKKNCWYLLLSQWILVLRNYKNISFSNYAQKGSALRIYIIFGSILWVYMFHQSLGRSFTIPLKLITYKKKVLYSLVHKNKYNKLSQNTYDTLHIISDERTINLKSNQGWFYLLYYNSWYKIPNALV